MPGKGLFGFNSFTRLMTWQSVNRVKPKTDFQNSWREGTLDSAASIAYSSPKDERLMKNDAKTVDGYLQALPADRRAAISAVRKVILANLPGGYEECFIYSPWPACLAITRR